MSTNLSRIEKMFDQEIQSALDEALSTGEATYKISKGRNALMLTVKNGNRLIPLMDKIFGFSDLDFIPTAFRNSSNAVPILKIDEYTVAPKIERRVIDDYHEYELMYSKCSLNQTFYETISYV